jgi:hypothetical protein
MKAVQERIESCGRPSGPGNDDAKLLKVAEFLKDIPRLIINDG